MVLETEERLIKTEEQGENKVEYRPNLDIWDMAVLIMI